MKICIITLAEKGGMVHYASQLSIALSKNNSVHMIVPEEMNEKIGDVNIVKITIPKKYLSLKTLKFNSLIKAIDIINPDIIHITSIHPWLIFTLPFLKKYSIFATIHDTKMHKGEWNPIWALSLRMLIKYADKLFIHGKKSKQTLIDNGISEDKLIVVPHGDYSFFRDYSKENVKETNSILFFGRILDYKGLNYLINAEPMIREKYPDLKVIIAGNGDFKKYRKLIGNSTKFEIHNKYLTEKEVAHLFQESGLVVLPYIEGTQSGVIPIAYSFKKPVIVSDVGDIPELVDDGITGFVIPPRDSRAIADSVLKLVENDKLRKQMGENGFKKMEVDLSWENIANKTISSYTEVLLENK